jgi:hypothetical protein
MSYAMQTTENFALDINNNELIMNQRRNGLSSVSIYTVLHRVRLSAYAQTGHIRTWPVCPDGNGKRGSCSHMSYAMQTTENFALGINNTELIMNQRRNGLSSVNSHRTP